MDCETHKRNNNNKFPQNSQSVKRKEKKNQSSQIVQCSTQLSFSSNQFSSNVVCQKALFQITTGSVW